MGESAEKTRDEVELLYREYVRLNARLDGIVDGVWNDFRLLGAVGALVAWAPIAQSGLFSQSDPAPLLFIGFVGILIVVSVIGVRNLIKETVIAHYLLELRSCETDLRSQLDPAKLHSFRAAAHWLDHRAVTWRGVLSRFYLLIGVFLVLFPMGVLAAQHSGPLAALYGLLALFCTGVFINGARLIGR